MAFHLGLLIGAFAVMLAGSVAALMTVMSSLRGDIADVTSVGQPLSTAALELEINTVGAGLGVAKYLLQFDEQSLGRFYNDKEDFQRFQAKFDALADTPDAKAHARQLAELYGRFTVVGENLIEYRRLWARLHAEYLAAEERLRSHLRDEAAKVPAGGGSSADLARLALAAEAVTAALYQDAPLGKMNAPDAVDAAARALSAAASGTEAASLGMDMERLATELNTVTRTIAAQFAELIQQRRALDILLDEDVQVMTDDRLQKTYASAAERVQWATWGAVAMAIAGTLLLAGALWFVKRRVVSPLQDITEATEFFNAGDRGMRIAHNYAGELGRLAKAFNQMAERISSNHARLTETNAQLDAEVAERTNHLAIINQQLERELAAGEVRERELSELGAKATAASAAKTIFLANMSHELRTPLNAILGFSEVLRSEMFGPLGDKYASYAADINESGARLLTLINNVLDVARLDMGGLALRRERLDLSTMLEESAQMLIGTAHEKDLTVTIDAERAGVAIYGDPLRMRQIIINVLGNAFKFTPRGGEVLAACRSVPGAVEIAITDNGIGMSTEELEKVFVPFAQADHSLARGHDGAGLGLSLAKRLTEAQGGTIDLQSDLGSGTTVTIRFPSAEEASGTQT